MLPFDFESTLEAFSSISPVTYETQTRTMVNGEATWATTTSTTTLTCIVLQATKLQQMYNREGMSMDGLINVITKNELFYTDAVGATNKQSYVTYLGVKYRVQQPGFLPSNSSVRSYTCIRSLQ
jgi:LysM repeat protein